MFGVVVGSCRASNASAELLGQRNDDALGPADIAEWNLVSPSRPRSSGVRTIATSTRTPSARQRGPPNLKPRGPDSSKRPACSRPRERPQGPGPIATAVQCRAPASRGSLRDSIESHLYEQRNAPQQIGREGGRGPLTINATFGNMNVREGSQVTLVDSSRSELLEATDTQIEDAVQYADPVVLRGLLYQLTGDDEIATTELTRGERGLIVASVEDVALLRRKTANFLKAYRDSGAGPIGIGPMERLPVSISLLAGEQVEGDLLKVLVEELALDPWARSHQWRETPHLERLQGFSVTLIGAGLGGRNAAQMR
jgi:hypothetical protein